MTRHVLPATVDLTATVALAETFRTAAAPVVLDAAGVDRIGVAGLQLLLSLHVHGLGGQPVVLENASDALCAAARTAGAHTLLATTR